MLGFAAANSAIDASVQKKNTWFFSSDSASQTATLIISNKEMNDIMKIVQALEHSGILLKGVTEAIKKETKKQKGGFLSMSEGTVRAGKGIFKKSLNAASSFNKF